MRPRARFHLTLKPSLKPALPKGTVSFPRYARLPLFVRFQGIIILFPAPLSLVSLIGKTPTRKAQHPERGFMRQRSQFTNRLLPKWVVPPPSTHTPEASPVIGAEDLATAEPRGEIQRKFGAFFLVF